MKKTAYLIIIGFLVFNYSFGQNQEKYSEFIKEALNLYEAKDFEKSAKKYKEAFDQLDGKANPNDRYNAACSYSLANDLENSFYHLFYLVEHPKIKYYSFITTDSDLESLHSDNRWEKLIAIVKANKDDAEKKLDKPLIAILDTIFTKDQTYRSQIGEIEETFGRESNEMKKHWELIEEKDSINLIKIKNILDEKGWLGPRIIGNQGNSTLFLVIQHSDLETQLKYLPLMREAAKQGSANPSSLALLEDRVALRQGKRQIYGSQIGRDSEAGEYYVSPMIDPENVDKRRAQVGLGTLQDYVSNWNIIWDVEKYKKDLSGLEQKLKN